MSEVNPWTKLSSALKYENTWISVTEHQVLTPSGTPGIYGVVNFKNIAIGIVPLDEHLNLTLVGQYRFALDAYSWELPEGGGPINTSPIENAQRELLEETGLKAEIWVELMRMHLSNSVSNELAIIYLARNLSKHQACPEDTEQLKLLTIPFEQAYSMVCSGEITDAMTVGALLKIKIMILDPESNL